MELPKDPVILLGVVNTKLRDFYPSFAALCEDLDVDGARVVEQLSAIGYGYCAERNRFE